MDRTTKYALDLVNGRNVLNRVVGRTEILSCKRHLNNLERQGTEDFPYIFDVGKSQEITDFAENLILAEGDEPQPLKLFSFQDFIFGSWNGWIHKDTKRRRFRTSYIRVARQQGKSIGNAVPAIFYGNFTGYHYPQIYTVATKELQARIVLKECTKFINSDVELKGTKTKKGLFTVKDYKSEIHCNLTNGVIKALGRDTESIDGFRPYFASVDEYHKHKTNQMYKLLTDGTKNLKECLISVITTAGFDLNCPCKELDDYCHTVLEGLVADETQFIFICELDKDDDIWDESNWGKANPLWTEETLTNLRNSAIKAKEMGGEELSNFMTKSLNMWVQSTDDGYLDLAKWKECESDTTLEDMRGRECYLGFDLSSGGDLTSGGLEFPLIIDGQQKTFVDSHSFLPKERLAEHIQKDKAPYDMWVREKLLTLTEGNSGVKVDYKFVINHYKKLIKDCDLKLKGIAYDPHNADAFLADLEDFGVDLFMITQSCKSLNDATVDFKLEVDANNIIYDKRNKLLTWSFTNAKTVHNSFGEIKIDKNSRVKRIDPCDALIDAHKIAIASKAAFEPNKYATDEFLNKLWTI